MSEETLRLEYIPLDLAMVWDDNQKRHDIGMLIASFKRHGFKDPPKYEPSLNNGDGAFVEGNGRTQALAAMKRDGMEPPRGIAQVDGEWLVPVLFGVDAASSAAAAAYGIDHNQITLMGGDFTFYDSLRMWDRDVEDQLRQLANTGDMPVSVTGDDLDALLALGEIDLDYDDEVEGFAEGEQFRDGMVITIRTTNDELARVKERLYATLDDLGLDYDVRAG